MFSGIIETMGTVRRVTKTGDDARLTVDTELAAALAVGESIAVNGVCLTVVGTDAAGFEADLSSTTLTVTALGSLSPAQPVNLERALRVGDRLSGHFVSGHVDATGTILAIRPDGESRHLRVGYPDRLRPYLVDKGSITVDGVSLTLVAVDADAFFITVIPHTLAVTTLGRVTVGQRVNLEADLWGQYVHRILAADGHVAPPAVAGEEEPTWG
jgi:riboflavin synthase